MSDTAGQLKRKRSKKACEPCRERKRKCDGTSPCTTCRDWGYDCYYASQPQSRLQKNSRRPALRRPSGGHIAVSSGSADHLPDQIALPADSNHHVRHLEANSGAAFVRKMGLSIDPENAPKMKLFGWNVGKRELLDAPTTYSNLPVVSILSEQEVKDLANIYFAKVHLCYAFIDRTAFFDRLEARWRTELPGNVYDSVLSGVAALGCLFSQTKMTNTEELLVQLTRSILDLHQISESPSVDLVTGWTLRVIYMRLTDTPHSTWIASSTLMHLIEAAGLHLELPSDTVFPRPPPSTPDIRRRIVGVAQHLNVWTSFDIGLSRVPLRGNLPLTPVLEPSDGTTEILSLLPASTSLDPEISEVERDFESSLSQILSGNHTHPGSVLAQCNLVLCVLRRLGMPSLNTPPALTEKVLLLLKRGLHSARTLVRDRSPWHHVANIPFHTICALLVIDTGASLAILPDAMQTLELVASIYDTDTTRLAYSTACLLVLLYQHRRTEDIKIFRNSLRLEENQVDLTAAPQLANSPSEEFAWLEDLVADIPSLQKADVDHFLNTNMNNPDFSTDFFGQMNLI